MNSTINSRTKTIDLTMIALSAALMAVCAWITIPAPAPFVPFTMQTFAVFLAVGLLGGKRGTIAVVVYILLGAIGLPIFSGMKGGLGVLLGTTGGYILGFLFSALLMWMIEHFLGHKTWVLALSMVLGLAVCYGFGTIWYMVVYTNTNGAVAIGTVLGWCVTPFILPDLIKIGLALLLTKRLKRYLPK